MILNGSLAENAALVSLSGDLADDHARASEAVIILIQSSALFLLYLLKRHPVGTAGELYDRFTRAFPMFTKPTQGEADTLEMLRVVFFTLVFEFFFAIFGFALFERRSGDLIRESVTGGR